MSLKFADLVAIRDSEGLTMTEKMCLTVIHSRGDKHTASVKTLTRNMGLKSDRHVREVLTGLREKGLINVVDHPGETSEITINTRALQKLVPKVTHAPEHMGTTPVVEDTPALQHMGGMRPSAGEVCAPEPTKENTKENMKEKDMASAGAAALSVGSTKDRTRKMTDSIIAEKREQAVVKSGEQNATPAPQRMGTPEAPVDYRAEAHKDKTVAYYFEKAKDVPLPSGGVRSDKDAYERACKKAGKEVMK